MSPVTPSELLIALHNIDCRNDEATLKAVVRGMLMVYYGFMVNIELCTRWWTGHHVVYTYMQLIISNRLWRGQCF